jgi:hypothetical protein
MPRKKPDTAYFTLRIRESLRRKLVTEAENRHWSLNNEIRWRLEQSFERQDLLSLTDSAAELRNLALRLDERFYGLDKQGDLLRAGEALVKAIKRNDHDAVKDGVIRFEQTTKSIEAEAAAIVRRMHTEGGTK